MITFRADRVKVTGPKADGGITVTFSSGQDEQKEIALLLAIPQLQAMMVEITPTNQAVMKTKNKTKSYG